MKAFIINKMKLASSASRGFRLASLLIVANLGLISVYATGWYSAVIDQLGPQKKKIEKHATVAKEPIEILGAKINGIPITLGREFDGDGDWLKGLKLMIRNKSEKPIAWIGINLLFPETRQTGPVMLDQVFIGQRPDMKTTNPPLDLKPGEDVEVSVESHLESIKRSLKKGGRLDNLNHLEINIDEVMFADGTLYSGDAIWKRNPDASSPRKWVKVSPE
jgi:hypothetical protein